MMPNFCRRAVAYWWLVALPLVVAGSLSCSFLSPVSQFVASALSIFVVVKIEAARHFATTSRRLTVLDFASWMLCWPGLDAAAFFTRRSDLRAPDLREWLWAAAKLLVGLACWNLIAPQLIECNELLGCWIALFGLLFTFHFGGFHLLTLVWRRAGRDVQPLMLAPIAATSLSDFWGRRWNRAFRDFAYEFVFKPLVRSRRPQWAHWAVFVFSGCVHELAISWPARTSYGLPLLYFLLQGLGVVLERRLPSVVDAQHPVRCWLWTALWTAPGAYWLFSPEFMHRIIVPLIGS